MPEFWEVTHARAQQTNAVWETHNPTFMVETLDLATHQANTTLLFSQVSDVVTAEDAHDQALDARDTNLALIHTLNTRVPQIIRSNLKDEDPLQKEVADVLKVKLGSFGKELNRARKLKSLWTRVDDMRAAMTPALPPIDRQGKVVADLDTAIAAHPTLMQAIEDELAELNQAKSTLEATERVVDDANKDWYEAWSNYYDPGSPEHDALSQIETEGGTSPPGALELQLPVQNGMNVDVTYTPSGGQHATSLTLLWQVEGVDPGFDNSAMVVLAGQTIGPFEMGQTINIKTRAENSAGATDSNVQSIMIM